MDKTNKFYSFFDVIRTMWCYFSLSYGWVSISHSIEDNYTFQRHTRELAMELWSMSAKGFPAIFSIENIDSASFSYELLYKGNVSSNNNDEHL